jgi:TolB protein
MRIVFQRELASGHNVVVMDADGSNLVNLTNDDGNNQDPDWSPDGGSIVYVSAIDGDFEIYSMNPDGSGRTDLTDNESSDFSPTWSPDGEKIAFVSNRDGNFEVYVMNADGSDQTRLTNNPAKDGDFSVDWQPLIIWGDNNCSGSADPVDSLLTLRFDAGLGTNTGGCPDMGEIVEVQDASLHPWGDVDCSADVTPVDSLKLLRFDAGLIVAQEAGCPGVGTGIKMVEG